MASPPSLTGTSAEKCQTFPFTIPTGTGSAATEVKPGGYYLISTVDAYLAVGPAGMGAATVPSTRSAAAALASLAINKTVFLPVGQVVPIDFTPGQNFFSVIGATGGTVVFSGPLAQSQVRG